MSKKKNFLFIAIMVVLLVAFPFLLEKLLHTPSQFGFVDGNNHSEWVGYYSSYISGLITLLGVYWTIQFTQEQNQGIIKEENKRFATQLRLENYPLVEIKASTIKRENISSPSIIYYKRQNDNEPKKLLIKFEIKNKGKSIISQASLIFPDNSSELVIINNGLEPNETGSVNVILTALSEKRNEDEAFIFDIHYEDIFYNQYKASFSLDVDERLEELKTTQLDKPIFIKVGNIEEQSLPRSLGYIENSIPCDEEKQKYQDLVYEDIYNEVKENLEEKLEKINVSLSQLIAMDKKQMGSKVNISKNGEIYNVERAIFLRVESPIHKIYFKIAKCDAVFEVDFKKKVWSLKEFEVDKNNSALNAFQRRRLKRAVRKYKKGKDIERVPAEEME
ncbi:hypothetical protein [uncultured Dubosiella sp.]|uniref:hypothetical protein n=1 Tax=uncultured Dubosiella sp. TaxID=1937011 RepID=UPI0025AF6BF6|nr:hypothetical protein [uncultured Dubosiella sp.]